MTDRIRTLAAATILAVLLAGTTAPSALFVVFRTAFGWTASDVGGVFAAYVLTLLPVLVLFGGVADRVGRRASATLGLALAFAGLIAIALAASIPAAVAARLAQGAAVGIASGSVTAVISQGRLGRLPGAAVTTIASNIGLMAGAVVTALAYDATRAIAPAVLPMIVLTLLAGSLVVLLPARGGAAGADGPAHATPIVTRALAFALPVTFVGWAGVSLFLGMVPSYVAAEWHVRDPLLGAATVAAVQLASIGGALMVRSVAPERAGLAGPAAVVAGLGLLVAGVTAGGTPGVLAIVAATVVVGAGGGSAFAAGVAATTRVCRGQRARVFAQLYVAAYLGFALPSWIVGQLAVRTSFAAAFTTVIVALAFVVAALPLLGRRAALHRVPA